MASNGNESNKITAHQQRAIAALLASRNVVEAAKQAKVGERTLHRWLTESAFRAALNQAEGTLIDAATRRLLQHQDVALTVILSIMANQEHPAGVRLRAAQTVLDHVIKIRELRDIEARLAELEAHYAQQST